MTRLTVTSAISSMTWHIVASIILLSNSFLSFQVPTILPTILPIHDDSMLYIPPHKPFQSQSSLVLDWTILSRDHISHLTRSNLDHLIDHIRTAFDTRHTASRQSSGTQVNPSLSWHCTCLSICQSLSWYLYLYPAQSSDYISKPH